MTSTRLKSARSEPDSDKDLIILMVICEAIRMCQCYQVMRDNEILERKKTIFVCRDKR